ncbi:MAG: carbohydrate ABC transporter permease [Butyricicoccus pullicaecorum]|nr:carbohydrate ABC transporter permease [Butyricicoccus pullicaecorum]MDO4668712.1 carbohydrate ABC transporter permease [Butyricicoccus pullicaecorum]
MKNTFTKGEQSVVYKLLSVLALILLAFFFIFPLYWIVTGSFKDALTINLPKPQWFPLTPTTQNYINLFKQPAFQWLLNTVIISVGAMILTCFTASLAGYALAKKRFYGQTILFTLFVCAMALPKQVIVIPLLQEMSALHLNNTLLAVILPTVGWPFGVFLMKQFSETIPSEILEAARVDGAGEVRTFATIVFPMIKPGIGALAIFTFVNTWNDYFLQLIMLQKREVFTLPLGIARLQGEVSSDFGLIMAGATLAAIPIVTVFLCFQKYFTQGITMGAVKG